MGSFIPQAESGNSFTVSVLRQISWDGESRNKLQEAEMGGIFVFNHVE